MKNHSCTSTRWRPRLLLRALTAALLLVLLVIPTVPAVHAAPYASVPITQNGRSILDGQAYLIDGVTYIPFRAFCELQGCGNIGWNAATRAAYATTPQGVTVCAFADGALYIRYGERYFYTVTPVRMVDDRVYIPIRPLAKCFGLSVDWDRNTRSVALTGTGIAPRADVGVYQSDDLYWLSRIIEAEAGGEGLAGKIAVGNVILNRVRSPEYPSTVYGVIFDREYGIQFTPTANGAIYCEPSEQSAIAARLCLEGYTVSEDILYFFNPRRAGSSWIARNREYAFRIGNHVFYK